MSKNRWGAIIIVVVLVGLIFGIVAPALACGGGPSLIGFDDPAAPKAIVLAAFANLSQQLGTKLDPTVTPWYWEEYVFANSSLECPKSGQTVDSTLTRGYHVIISVWANDTYDNYYFNATKDGRIIFQCTKAGPGQVMSIGA